MKKMLYVAQREFLATVGTKAFIFGILVTPLVIGVLILLIPWMSRQDPPAIAGSVAVIDPTGQVTAGLAAYLEPARIEERRREAYQRIQDAMPSALRSASGTSGPGAAAGQQAVGSDARQGAAAHGRGPGARRRREHREGVADLTGGP